MSSSRWWWRLVLGLVVFAALEAVLVLVDLDPDAVRLALLVAICVAVLGLVLDVFGDSGASWTVPVEGPSVRETGDPRLSGYVFLLEAHVSARSYDTAVCDRLGVLADQVLRQRYGWTRDDPRAVALMGEELTAVLNRSAGPPSPAEIERCLTRIEEL